jgi:hypothetical protein
MPKYEEVAGKVFWVIGTLFVALLVLVIGGVILDKQYPELLNPAPVPPPQVKRSVFMPPLRNIKLVLDRYEVRNPGDRVKKALKECIGNPPALIGTGRGTEKILADATETDVFYFYCSSPESWKMLAGRAGLVKMREGKPVDDLVLFLN